MLIGGVKKRFKLSDRRGQQNLLLAFYPLNWEPISTEQMVAYQVERDRFVESGSEVVGISVDSIMNTTAWEREIGPFDYPLCSDFWPHGIVSLKYGVFTEAEPFAGCSQRAIFIVDKMGRIQFSKIYMPNEVPALQESLEILRRL